MKVVGYGRYVTDDGGETSLQLLSAENIEPIDGSEWFPVYDIPDHMPQHRPGTRRPIVPDWFLGLPYQQQSVMMLATRGPDGIAKSHPCKEVQRAYRGTVLRAAARGRMLNWDEHGDSFMSLWYIAKPNEWFNVCATFFHEVDSLPHHFVMHLLHGAEIIGYKHPDPRYRAAWSAFYKQGVTDMHLNFETETEMDMRLNDFGRHGKDWSQEDLA